MKILIEESVLRQALEALEPHKSTVLRWITPVDSAITALRAAIKATEKYKPVAWMGEYNINDIRDHYTVVMRHKTDFSGMPDRVLPLYTTPQPAIPADVIRQAQAQALRDAADRLELQNWDSAADELRRMADELERKA